ncbi:MAG: hypothetical protein U9R72_16945 [Chloroflexota bacterium]|nr:hypothetical protein [Chloroflexota bacterium]
MDGAGGHSPGERLTEKVQRISQEHRPDPLPREKKGQVGGILETASRGR